jgi:hypothetical protein
MDAWYGADFAQLSTVPVDSLRGSNTTNPGDTSHVVIAVSLDPEPVGALWSGLSHGRALLGLWNGG